jgi:hypothetical protein
MMGYAAIARTVVLQFPDYSYMYLFAEQLSKRPCDRAKRLLASPSMLGSIEARIDRYDSNAEADENRVQLIGIASLARVPVVPKRRRYAVDAMSAERLKLNVCAKKPSKYIYNRGTPVAMQ